MTYAVDLGKIKFNWQGDYNAATTYTRDDVVYHNGNAYVCIVASSVNQDPSTATAQWNKMVQGSDLGAISGLAANDLIYYDGTDFQRLPAGTQGQSLVVGANGLEWGNTVQSGQVLEMVSGICDGRTITGQSGNVTLQNVTGIQNFSTGYQDVTGSVVSYQPPANATKVRYQFSMQLEDTGYGGISHFRLYLSNDNNSGWNEIQKAYSCHSWQYDSNAHGNCIKNFDWTFDIGQVSSNDYLRGRVTSWNTPRMIKWYAREYDGSYQIRGHHNTWRDGGGATGNFTWRYPVLTITAIA